MQNFMVKALIQQLKKGVKILGIACSSFNRLEDQFVPIFGVVYRGASLFEGVLKTRIEVDGEDATEKIRAMIEQSNHSKQLKLIMTRGITIAGFNYIDIKKLYEKTGLPVISIVDRKPNFEKIRSAIKNVPNWEERYKVITNSGLIREIQSSEDEEPVFIQSIGFKDEEIATFLKKVTVVGRIPEPIRVARLIATAKKF